MEGLQIKVKAKIICGKTKIFSGNWSSLYTSKEKALSADNKIIE